MSLKKIYSAQKKLDFAKKQAYKEGNTLVFNKKTKIYDFPSYHIGDLLQQLLAKGLRVGDEFFLYWYIVEDVGTYFDIALSETELNELIDSEKEDFREDSDSYIQCKVTKITVSLDSEYSITTTLGKNCMIA
jgi:hypothetical protein